MIWSARPPLRQDVSAAQESFQLVRSGLCCPPPAPFKKKGDVDSADEAGELFVITVNDRKTHLKTTSVIDIRESFKGRSANNVTWGHLILEIDLKINFWGPFWCKKESTMDLEIVFGDRFRSVSFGNFELLDHILWTMWELDVEFELRAVQGHEICVRRDQSSQIRKSVLLNCLEWYDHSVATFGRKARRDRKLRWFK